jgi:hypothetical protein
MSLEEVARLSFRRGRESGREKPCAGVDGQQHMQSDRESGQNAKKKRERGTRRALY